MSAAAGEAAWRRERGGRTISRMRRAGELSPGSALNFSLYNLSCKSPPVNTEMSGLDC